MINYIIQIMLFQLLFLAIYDLFLRKETFFVGNRIYLLITPVLAFIIPFIKLPSSQLGYTNEVSIMLPEIVLSPQRIIESSTVLQYVGANFGVLIFWIGCSVLLGLFLYKLGKLGSLIRKNPVNYYKEYKLVKIAKSRKAFSFFNYIFLGENISEADRHKVIEHEIVHSRQKHSMDLLLFEVLKIVMWFNPLIYIFQKRITAVHEFISDSSVIKNNQREQYINTLLNELFEVDNFSFINQFYKKSILKKRIIMMTKKKSNQIMQTKYLMLLPLLVGMLFYVSCSDEFQTSETNKSLEDLPDKTSIMTTEALSFTVIDKVPTFPGCEENDKNCFNKKIQKHFTSNFDFDLPNSLNLSSGKNRLIVMFTIDREGSIGDIKVRAPHSKLENEAKRVINSMPQLIPGEHNGETVAVKYILPVRIEIE